MRHRMLLWFVFPLSQSFASCKKQNGASAVPASDSSALTAPPVGGLTDSGTTGVDSARQSTRRARSAARADQVDRRFDNPVRASRAPTLRHKPGEARADTFKKPERTPIYPATPPPRR
ncbi:MAG: hypothetical protein M3068_12170 [Gemmatimonadota bacterium]|nr:hypothetical protein [Gemmatimonadota bacterium]